MREYAFFTNFPTPQKVDFFNVLNDRLDGRIVFFFYTLSVPKRDGWEGYIRKASFRYDVLPSLRIGTSFGRGSDEAYAFIPKSFPDLSPFRKVVISGGLTPTELFLSLKAVASGIPYVLWTGAISVGDLWRLFYRAPLRFLMFSNAETVVAATSLAAEHAKRLGAKRVEVAYTTFNTERFDYERHHSGHCIRVLFVGRLIKRKKVDDLIEAVSGLNWVTLDIVGDGPLREELEDKVRNSGSVSFLGKVPYERMPSIYRKYDVLVLPASSEVFGYVVLEAAMSSTAVVVSDGVGAKDFLPDSAIFPVGDISALREKLKMMSDPNVRNFVVAYAKDRIRKLATPKRWADVFARVLEK